MSLNSSLSIAVQSLIASTGALQATNNNIANANTPGYSRQVVTLQAAAPTNEGNISIGNGVVLEGFQSVRDELLQTRIQQQTQAQSGANAQLSSMQQIQPIFTKSTNDIGTEMSAMFSSLSSLATNPSNSSLRQAVLVAGQNLASSFNSASSALTTQQTNLNSQVTQDVSQINQLTQQIAALNPQIAELKATGQDGGTLQDQQDQLVLSLSKLTDVAVTNTESGVTLTTGSGTPLVVGTQSFGLQTAMGADGMQHVLDHAGADITDSLQSGDLGGTIQTRDQTIPGLMTQLDNLAYQVGSSFNSAQAAGFDQNGAAGGNFFTIPTSATGAAGTITMALQDPTAIAASSDGTAGSSGNLTNFTNLQTTAPAGGQTPTDLYANLVYQVGSLTANATAESSATTASLSQLNDQRNSVSGVSVDEESTNLITYQQAYEAAARVVTTIQELFQVTMSMGTASAA
jgi:flagellar hook-associated protein 1 FlgK